MTEHSTEIVPKVEWAHLLDDAGSADMYDSEEEARSMMELCGGGLARVEITVIVPVDYRPADGGDDRG